MTLVSVILLAVFVMPRSRAGSQSARSVASSAFRSAASVTPSMSVSQAPSRRSVTFTKRGKQGPRALARSSSVVSSTRASSVRSRPVSARERGLSRRPLSSGGLAISPSVAHRYWDAALHSTPPNIPTTYGNFTCVNSLARFAITTQVSVPLMMQFAWTPSPLRATYFNTLLTNATKVGCWQQAQLNASNTAPLDIRPLRMCVKLKNVTQNLNIASNIVAVLVPQSLTLTYSLTGGTTMPFFSSATTASLWSFAENNPKSASYTGAEMAKNGRTFVMPPASFLSYNAYRDWAALSSVSDNGTVMSSDDWAALNRQPVPTVFPATISDAWLGEIPPLYHFLVNFEPNSLPQTYEVEVFCQDACRFPANSLVASMAGVSDEPNLTMDGLSKMALHGASNFHGGSSGSGRSGRAQGRNSGVY